MQRHEIQGNILRFIEVTLEKQKTTVFTCKEVTNEVVINVRVRQDTIHYL